MKMWYVGLSLLLTAVFSIVACVQPQPTPTPAPTPLRALAAPTAGGVEGEAAPCNSIEDAKARQARVQAAMRRPGGPPQDVRALMPELGRAIAQGDFQTACKIADRALALLETGAGQPAAGGPPMATPIPRPTATPTPVPTPAVRVNRTTHGHITWDEIWRNEMRVTGDIVVHKGATLTIEPGTRVVIAAHQDAGNIFTEPFNLLRGIATFEGEGGVLKGEPFRDEGNHISIRIHGTLHAVGTPDRMITITSSASTPTIYDWNYLQIDRGVLSYAIVEYYRVMGVGVFQTGKVEVSHNILRQVGECGVCLMDSGEVVIEHNRISVAGHELIDMHRSSPVIRNNHLGPNPIGAGIVIDGGSPHIESNTIEGTHHGILFVSPPQAPVIKDNVFANNINDVDHTY